MPQAVPRYPTVEDYLNSDEHLEGRYEYADGELIPLVAESEVNDNIAIALQFYLVLNGFFPRRLVKTHSCEIQVDKFHQNDKQTRLPDLVILKPEHLALTQRRLTIRKAMPAPLLVAEVVSPYSSSDRENYEADYLLKPYQYAHRGIPEYWIIDPQAEVVIVCAKPSEGSYAHFQEFSHSSLVRSQLPELSQFSLTAQEILEPDA